MKGFWDRTDWERIWFRTQSRDWRALAVVPSDVETEAAAYDMARFIAGLATQHEEKLSLADFRDVPLPRVSAFLQLADWHLGFGERLIYATRSIAENVATVRVARSADCVLLCASLGTTPLRAIEDAIEQIGRDRFLGSVLFRPPKRGRANETALVKRSGSEAWP